MTTSRYLAWRSDGRRERLDAVIVEATAPLEAARLYYSTMCADMGPTVVAVEPLSGGPVSRWSCCKVSPIAVEPFRPATGKTAGP